MRFEMGGAVELMERAETRGKSVCDWGEVSGGCAGREGGMWSRHTFSLARLEPTRTGVGSPGAKIERVRMQDPED